MLKALENELNRQKRELGRMVEILIDSNEGSIGAKSNNLLDICWGTYCCRFDDDDWPGPNYLKRIFEGIDKGVDCCSLRGMYYEDGVEVGIFEHSLKYNIWKTNDVPVNGVKFERYPNHLNAIKSSIAKQFKYPDISFGEDKVWSDSVFNSGLLKTEHYIPEIIYEYRHISNKRY